ncbi:MAG: hypothetical protein CBB96_07675 [Gammaproteobacteria bacterium TMED36]|nr:MAG: hypothetical protein CBB96_07675 [Gammaproteobacteria bacterium TMED36]|tara:strand:- start:4553 stop:5257 length:705 start_codon:yes stop_codon:yes gene_type:complete
MLRNVYLEGTMGQEFGTEFQIYAETVADAIRCLEANIGDKFRKYLIGCHEEDTGFLIDVADNTFDNETELLMPMHEGDITITPMPAGSKSALGKILAAIIIITIAITRPDLFVALAESLSATTGLTITAGNLQLATAFFGVQIGLMGVMQLMAPDPSIDTDGSTNYLYNGPQQNIVQGDPVPVLYGKLRVPGQPVNFELSPVNTSMPAALFNEDGSTSMRDYSAIYSTSHSGSA